MKELFITIFSKYKRPVLSKFKERLIGHFRGSKIKPSLASCYPETLLVRKLCMRNTVTKLTFNVTFINKSYGQKKMRYLKPDPSPK